MLSLLEQALGVGEDTANAATGEAHLGRECSRSAANTPGAHTVSCAATVPLWPLLPECCTTGFTHSLGRAEGALISSAFLTLLSAHKAQQKQVECRGSQSTWTVAAALPHLLAALDPVAWLLRGKHPSSVKFKALAFYCQSFGIWTLKLYKPQLYSGHTLSP